MWFEPDPELVAKLDKIGPAHKRRYGHAMTFAGPSGRGGAARLAARAALRTGAGLATVLCPMRAAFENVARLPDAIMVAAADGAADLSAALAAVAPNALCVGPGLGLEDDARSRLAVALDVGAPCCIDADAITLMSMDPRARPRAPAVLTPHLGEFRRLFPSIEVPEERSTVEPCPRRLNGARAAADAIGQTVLLKGAITIVADPDGNVRTVGSDRARWRGWLATAGSGDVLAGVVTGLLARGFAAYDAASVAAWLHQRCADVVGPAAIADDAPDALRRVFADVLAAPSGQAQAMSTA